MDIMIVDDNPTNLTLLREMLQRRGHEVRSFPLGRLAIAAAMRRPPDLILLDINMPEMSGYEVCERLKSTGQLADIPVIFLSALTEIQDKVKAFQSGGVDYISKPFQFEEVHARVETHLKLHRLQRDLKLHNERLEESVTARTRELAEANARLTILDRSKNDFLNLISHEFRTPLNGLLGVGELIMEGVSLSEENKELQQLFEQSRQRILAILDDAMLLAEIDAGAGMFKSAPVSLGAILSGAIGSVAELAESRQVTLTSLPTDPGVILGDVDLLQRAFRALLETAVEFSGSGETVTLAHEVAGESTKLVIESRGQTIPDRALAKVFAIQPGGELGLGPPVAERILSLFGASVSVANRDSSGVRLTILLKNAAYLRGGAPV